MSRSPTDLVLAANRRLIVEGDLEATSEFFAPGYVVHLTDGDRRGLPFVRRHVQQVRRAFRDLEVEVVVLSRARVRIAWIRTCRGTHRSALRGLPPTGEPVRWRDPLVSRVEAGRIAEEWAVSDLVEHLLEVRSQARSCPPRESGPIGWR